ncbi:MAG: hypothetical protein AAB835_02565 [Patescibacteria group bacterium]
MNNPRNNEQKRTDEKRILPLFIEFVKFTTGFAAIVAAALIALNIASAAMN